MHRLVSEIQSTKRDFPFLRTPKTTTTMRAYGKIASTLQPGALENESLRVVHLVVDLSPPVYFMLVN